MDTAPKTTNEASSEQTQSAPIPWAGTAKVIMYSLFGILGMAYIIGMLVASRHYQALGISRMSFWNADYLMSGLAWCSMAAAGYLFTQCIPYLVQGSRVVRVLKFTIALACCLFFIYFVLNEYTGDRFTMTRKSTWGYISVIGLGGMYMYLAGLTAKKIMKHTAAPRKAGQNSMVYKRIFSVFVVIAALVYLLSWYGSAVFPHLSHKYGGGKWQLADFVVKADAVTAVNSLAIPITPGTRMTGMLWIMHEAPDYFLVAAPDGYGGVVKSIRINKDIVDSVRFIRDVVK